MPALRELWQQLTRHHGEVGAWPVRDLEESWSLVREKYVRWLREEEALLLLGFVAGEASPAGYAFVVLERDPSMFARGDVVGELHTLAVDGECRGQGVGAALLEASRSALRARRAGLERGGARRQRPSAGALPAGGVQASAPHPGRSAVARHSITT